MATLCEGSGQRFTPQGAIYTTQSRERVKSRLCSPSKASDVSAENDNLRLLVRTMANEIRGLQKKVRELETVLLALPAERVAQTTPSVAGSDKQRLSFSAHSTGSHHSFGSPGMGVSRGMVLETPVSGSGSTAALSTPSAGSTPVYATPVMHNGNTMGAAASVGGAAAGRHQSPHPTAIAAAVAPSVRRGRAQRRRLAAAQRDAAPSSIPRPSFSSHHGGSGGSSSYMVTPVERTPSPRAGAASDEKEEYMTQEHKDGGSDGHHPQLHRPRRRQTLQHHSHHQSPMEYSPVENQTWGAGLPFDATEFEAAAAAEEQEAANNTSQTEAAEGTLAMTQQRLDAYDQLEEQHVRAALALNDSELDDDSDMALAIRMMREEVAAAQQQQEGVQEEIVGEYVEEGDVDELDPDEMTYEEMLELGSRLGDVKQERWRERAPDIIAGLPTHMYSSTEGTRADSPGSAAGTPVRRPNSGTPQSATALSTPVAGAGAGAGAQVSPASTASDAEECPICRCGYEDGDMLMTLPCEHFYHGECIEHWLKDNNSCPLCQQRVAGTPS